MVGILEELSLDSMIVTGSNNSWLAPDAVDTLFVLLMVGILEELSLDSMIVTGSNNSWLVPDAVDTFICAHDGRYRGAWRSWDSTPWKQQVATTVE